jgi:tetratricopeptide (TPR) repeat protein
VANGFQLRADPENEALRSEAVREAGRALELEPANGEAYLALELALPRFNWQEREMLLLKGIKADPGFGPGAVMEGRLLSAVGRNKDALFWYRRAYNIDPLHNNNTFPYAASLMWEGFPKESRELLEQMDAQWPQHIATRNAHFWTSLLSGARDETLAVLADASRWPDGWPIRMNQKSAEAWRLALAAHPSATGAAPIHAVKAVKDSAEEGSLSRGEALLLLSMLNDVDGAFAQAAYYLPADPQWGPLLFLEQTRPMRQDRRFIGLAVKYGFAAYWRSTGQWPDFCKAPDLPYDCGKEVDKALAAHPGEGEMIKVRSAAIPY